MGYVRLNGELSVLEVGSRASPLRFCFGDPGRPMSRSDP